MIAVALCAIMLLSSAAMYAVVADAGQTLVITAIGLGISLLAPRAPLTSSRTIIYGSVAVLAIATFDIQIFPVKGERFLLLPAELYCPLLLYSGVGLTLFVRYSTSYAGIGIVSLIVLTLAGNTVGLPTDNQHFTAANGLVARFPLVYGVGVAINVLALILLFPRAVVCDWLPGRGHIQHRLLRASVASVAVLLLAGTTIATRSLAGRYEQTMSRLLNVLIKHYAGQNPKSVVFGQDIDLWRTLPYRGRHDKTPVLRVLAKQSPGYLRGRAYDSYAGGRWQDHFSPTPLRRTWANRQVAYTTFKRRLPPPAGKPRTHTLSLLPTVRHATDVMLVPARAHRIEMVAENLASGPSGALFQQKWKQQAGARVTVDSMANAYPAPTILDSTMERRWLKVPNSLKIRLTPHVKRLAKNLTDKSTTAERVQATVTYLRQRCDYEIGFGLQSAARVDPVVQFLDRNRKGHCELFATSASLLLRAQDVPTRYVTGFVCRERLSGGYWITRLRDAHAWLEAYDAEQKRWVHVEATPAAGVPQEDDSPPSALSWFDSLAMGWDWVKFHIGRGDFTAAVVGLVRSIYQTATQFLSKPLGRLTTMLALFVLFALLVWLRLLRHRKYCRSLGHLDAELARMSTRLLRHLRKRYGIQRAQTETWNELLDRMPRQTPDSTPPQTSALIHQFQAIRFNPRHHTEQNLHKLAEQIRQL